MKVINTFFRENCNYPSFELENGEIKHPYFLGYITIWLTDKEFKEQELKKVNHGWKIWKYIF
jgi:hypothetical protein